MRFAGVSRPDAGGASVAPLAMKRLFRGNRL